MTYCRRRAGQYLSSVLLYHYTAAGPCHLEAILRDQRLTTTESNVSATQEHAGPDVVWLTSEDDPTKYGLGLTGSAVDKRRIRITVDVEDAVLWLAWAKRQRSPQRVIKAMSKAGGFRTWYVVERPIPSSEWVEILDRETGEKVTGWRL
jgi:hypothetical protein